MVFSNNLLMGAAGQATGYEIDQSIRFNKSASGSMSRTFGTPTDRNKFTYAFWMKPCSESNGYCLETNVGGTSGTDFSGMVFNGGSFQFFDYTSGSANIDVRTTFTSGSGKFRDYTGWYHAMFVFDSDEGTDSDRLKLFVNGRQFPAGSLVGPGGGSPEWPTSGENSRFNASGTVHRISSSVNGLVDGYMADIYFIDGQALTPTSFGEFSSTNGEFVPIAYEGAFGNNGFYIDGRDSSDLGDDESGNGNDFSTSNMGTDDQVTDSPTNNTAIWNSLIPLGSGSFTDGNLQFAETGGSVSQHAKSTVSFTSGEKKVCEMQIVSGSSITFGICDEDFDANSNSFTGDSRGYFSANGNKIDKDGNSSSYGGSFTSSNVIRIEVDLSSNPGTIEFFKDGVSQGDAFTDITSTKTWFFWCRCKSDTIKANFGQLGFAGTPTSGFTAPNVTNLPDPAITDPKRYFGTLLYTGNGTTGQTVTGLETTSGTSWTPDWVWIKPRSAAYNSKLFDSVRTLGFSLESSTANAEANLSAEFIAFADGGFQVDDNGSNNINQSGITHVAWCWEAGGGGSSNSDGSVTSSVSNNSTANFSIVKYTGTGSGNSTVGHGLGTTPTFIILKHLDRGQNWRVFHTAEGVGETGFLNTTDAFAADPDRISAVSSTTFTAKSNMNESAEYIAYCFADVEGYSKFGGYTGNGSTNGTYVHLGFKPAFLFFKVGSTSDAWQIYDNKRRTFNAYGESIAPNSNAVEGSFSERVDLLSTGFKTRSTNTAINGSGENYVYAAFAHSPFKTATAFGIES